MSISCLHYRQGSCNGKINNEYLCNGLCCLICMKVGTCNHSCNVGEVGSLHSRAIKAEKDRDAMQAQIGWMVWALGEIRGPMCCGTCANLVSPFCFAPMHCSKDGKKCNNDDWCKEWRPKGWREVFAKDALAMTPPEAARRVNGLLRALEFYATKYSSEWQRAANDDFGEMARKALAEWKGEKA